MRSVSPWRAESPAPVQPSRAWRSWREGEAGRQRRGTGGSRGTPARGGQYQKRRGSPQTCAAVGACLRAEARATRKGVALYYKRGGKGGGGAVMRGSSSSQALYITNGTIIPKNKNETKTYICLTLQRMRHGERDHRRTKRYALD